MNTCWLERPFSLFDVGQNEHGSAWSRNEEPRGGSLVLALSSSFQFCLMRTDLPQAWPQTDLMTDKLVWTTRPACQRIAFIECVYVFWNECFTAKESLHRNSVDLVWPEPETKSTQPINFNQGQNDQGLCSLKCTGKKKFLGIFTESGICVIGTFTFGESQKSQNGWIFLPYIKSS